MKESFIKECKQLGELYNHNYNISEKEQESIYNWIQNEQRKIVDIKLANSEPDEAGDLDTKIIAKYLNNSMQRNKIFGWKFEDEMDCYIKYTKITAIIRRKYYAYEFDFKLCVKFNPKDVVWFCREKRNR